MSGSEIIIKPVSSSSEMKQFVALPERIYRDTPQYVPDMELDVKDMFNPRKNASLAFCDYQLFLAIKGGEVVGRVAAMINPRANETWQSRYVRFGMIEFIDDINVSRALIDAVAQWGRERGMESIQGPMGFTDYDKEGMLIGDFDQDGSMITFYNHPYYPEHMKQLGFEKEADWIQIQVDVPSEMPPRFARVVKLVEDRFKLRVCTYKKRELYGKVGHDVFHLLNQAYAPLFGFTPFDEPQIDQLLRQYVPLLNPDMMPVVLNDKDEMVGVAITLPSMSDALRKSHGRILPLGWYHLLRSLKWKYEEKLELLLIGVRPDYHGLGVNSLFFKHLIPVCSGLGFKYAETGPQLENNLKELSQWRDLNPKYVKPRRCWKKSL